MQGLEDEDPGDDEEGKKKSKLTDLIIGAAPIEKNKFLLTINIFKGEYVPINKVPISDCKEINVKLKLFISEKDSFEIEVIQLL